jgi:hypothetical protein
MASSSSVALSFLGWSPAAHADVGRHVADGRVYLSTAWWLATFPARLSVTVPASTRSATVYAYAGLAERLMAAMGRWS